MKKIFVILISANLYLMGLPAMSSERTRRVMKEDTTERLENIKELKQNIRSMKLRLKNFETAIAEAKKKPTSYKTNYTYVRKIAEVATTLTLLTVAVSAYRIKGSKPSKLVKPASVLAAISSAVSGVSGALADLSDNELDLLNNKVKELKAELSATEKNLSEETYLLCSQEPSNQMCTNFVQR